MISTYADKNHIFIAIGEEFFSLRAFVCCVPLETVEIPNLLRTKEHKSL